MLFSLASLTFLIIAYVRRNNEERDNAVKNLQDRLDRSDSERAALSRQLQSTQEKLDKLQQELRLKDAASETTSISHGKRVRADECEMVVGSISHRKRVRADECEMSEGSVQNTSPSMYKQPEEDVPSSSSRPGKNYEQPGEESSETGVGSVQDLDTGPSMYKQPEDVSSSSRPGKKYDVFLSFRGTDTRNNFVGHLYKGLNQKGIYTFKDDQKLQRGKSISPELLNAIQESRFSIVVLSENYATSSWCLDELVKIMECSDQYGHKVVPIFYNVEPSDVRNQTGSFAKAFVKHEEDFKEEREKVLIWRKALTWAANFAGYHSSRDRDESTLVDLIVRDISNRVLYSESSNELVGIDGPMQRLVSLLSIESGGVRAIGIWGMGGIGKTTIAKAIYDRLAPQFEGRCFIENIKDRYKKHRPAALQNEILSKVLLEENLSLSTLDGGSNVIRERLCHKKLFVVLDDVDDVEQLEALAGKSDWLGPGSRIIITTRDKHLLDLYKVNYTHEVENLEDVNALQLFTKFAFKQDHPPVDYLELSNHFVSYTGGVPLALKVLGSSLYCKTISEWKSALNKLQRIPDLKIQNVLSISLDGLDDKQKGLFLDVACFFEGEDKDYTMGLLDGCDFFSDTDLRVLVDKSLVTISDNKLCLHDLIQQMGQEVVRQECVQEPGNRSRLWISEDVCRVLTRNTGTKAVEGIFFDTSKLKRKEAYVSSDAFKRMSNLRILKFYSSHDKGFEENCKVDFPQGLEFLPEELRYLRWDSYPLKSLPLNFHPEYLVELDMSCSNLERLWEGVKPMPKLKRIDLSHSKHLKEIPDLLTAQNLESIILIDCTSLLEVHPSTRGLKSLKDLTLSGCSKLKICPEIPRNVKQVHLDGTIIQELHSSLQSAHKLEELNLKNCKNLVSLPDGFCDLKCLNSLNISGCSNLASLPENFGYLKSLVTLEADESGIKLLPPSLGLLEKIKTLSFRGCKGEDTTGLLLPPLSGLSFLKGLDLSGCDLLEFPEGLSCLSTLEYLDLSGSKFESFPANINLSSIKVLRLRACKSLQTLPKFPPSIRTIDARDCTSLEEVSSLSCEPIACVITDANFESSTFIFTNCFNLNQNARNNIIAVVQQKIQAVANASSPQSGQWPRFSPTSICFPRSGLPKWLIHQRRGSKITVELPSHSSNTYVAVALGAVVSFEDDHYSDGNFILRCEFHLKGDTHILGHPICFIDCSHNGIKNLEPIFVQLDHLFLGFQYLFHRGCCPKAKATIKFKVTNDRENWRQLEGCEVKMCGAFLV